MTNAIAIAQGGSNNVTFRNKIINGACVIDQRNAGASITPSTGSSFAVDRFVFQPSVASKFSLQQNAGSVTPPVGFTNYLGATSLSAYSIGASDYFNLGQNIEGFNFADMQWGTANAKTITLSFWVRSSLTGTFGVSFRNDNADRNYQASYTISSANTWEQKTITVAGDTSGTWTGATNGTGLRLGFGLGIGSTYSTTAGAWSAGNYFGLTGATSVVGTNTATFYITGVQLEAGTTASPFEYRQYGTELALCQRYCQVIADSSQQCLGFVNGSQAIFYAYATLCVPLRASSPSVSYSTTLNPTTNAANLSTVTGINSVGYAPGTTSVKIAYTINSTPSASPCATNTNGGNVFLTSEL